MPLIGKRGLACIWNIVRQNQEHRLCHLVSLSFIRSSSAIRKISAGYESERNHKDDLISNYFDLFLG
jgi:hypothetical protein